MKTHRAATIRAPTVALCWAIPEGYIPRASGGQPRCHETARILNSGDRDAHVEIMILFIDRDPVGPYRITVPARRARHVRLDDLDDPRPIPRDTDFATLITSDVPIVVQHTRLDSTHEALALPSTIPYAGAR